MFVQQVIKDLHKRKILALFIKLDISKAFDIVNWPYLLNIMEHLGFGLRWRNWISSLWNTTSSTFLVNGEPGKRILHCRGVRQGDPLSPLLFILAMEPLHRLIRRAHQMRLLTRLSEGIDEYRISMYADDAALFIAPS
jgi:retron-type reverse transcriptase